MTLHQLLLQGTGNIKPAGFEVGKNVSKIFHESKSIGALQQA